MNHTPGPWFADDDSRIWRRHPSELYQNGGGLAGDKPIATCWDGWEENGYPRNSNARLIAAAPELLDSLSKLVAFYVRIINSGDCGNWDPETDAEIINARAAIAKAEGK